LFFVGLPVDGCEEKEEKSRRTRRREERKKRGGTHGEAAFAHCQSLHTVLKTTMAEREKKEKGGSVKGGSQGERREGGKEEKKKKGTKVPALRALLKFFTSRKRD